MTESHIHLQLSGVKCAGCVGKIEKALQSVSGVHEANINFPDRIVSIIGSASADRLVRAVEAIGFDASLIDDNAYKYRFSIPSMNCGSCVGKIEYALKTLPNVLSFNVILAEKRVVVEGSITQESIEEALESAGFPSIPVTSEVNQQQTQAQEDRNRYHVLSTGDR